MDIIKCFPFDLCESCEECVLDVNDRNMYSNNGIYNRIVTVGCKNERLCRKLKQKGNDNAEKQ